eukprot:UN23940
MKNELYSKRFGHKEWVTCCEILENGEILSGGLDATICHWKKNVVSCVDLCGHTKSISNIAGSKDSKLCISAAYDKTICYWDLISNKCVNILKKHQWPIISMKVDWSSDQFELFSGDRKGKLILWNGEKGKPHASFKKNNEHTGSVISSLLDDKMVITGCTNGLFQILDRRNGDRIFSHHFKGSVNDIQRFGSNT